MLSTIVEILLYYLTIQTEHPVLPIYNSRNSFILLNSDYGVFPEDIYNSRNSFILLNSYTVNIHNFGAVFLFKLILFITFAHIWLSNIFFFFY